MKEVDSFFINKILGSNEFSAFHSSMRKHAKMVNVSHTMMGFNYDFSGISSVKFYYVFNANKADNATCPIPELSVAYSSFLQHADWPRVSARLSAGAGITFAIKFDRYFNRTQGFFFRVDRSSEELVGNLSRMHPQFGFGIDDFYEGQGQYVLESQGEASTSEYVYLKNAKRLSALEAETGIAFSQAGCIEIAAANSKNKSDQKFIAIGDDRLIGSGFAGKIPPPILRVFDGMQWQFCCPAYSPEKKQFTIYVTGKLSGGIFQCSLIDALVARQCHVL